MYWAWSWQLWDSFRHCVNSQRGRMCKFWLQPQMKHATSSREAFACTASRLRTETHEHYGTWINKEGMRDFASAKYTQSSCYARECNSKRCKLISRLSAKFKRCSRTNLKGFCDKAENGSNRIRKMLEVNACSLTHFVMLEDQRVPLLTKRKLSCCYPALAFLHNCATCSLPAPFLFVAC